MLILPLRLQLRLLLRLHLLHHRRIWCSTHWSTNTHLLLVYTCLLLPLHHLLHITHSLLADLHLQALDLLLRDSALISPHLLHQLRHILLVELLGALCELLGVNWISSHQ